MQPKMTLMRQGSAKEILLSRSLRVREGALKGYQTTSDIGQISGSYETGWFRRVIVRVRFPEKCITMRAMRPSLIFGSDFRSEELLATSKATKPYNFSIEHASGRPMTQALVISGQTTCFAFEGLNFRSCALTGMQFASNIMILLQNCGEPFQHYGG